MPAYIHHNTQIVFIEKKKRILYLLWLRIKRKGSEGKKDGFISFFEDENFFQWLFFDERRDFLEDAFLLRSGKVSAKSRMWEWLVGDSIVFRRAFEHVWDRFHGLFNIKKSFAGLPQAWVRPVIDWSSWAGHKWFFTRNLLSLLIWLSILRAVTFREWKKIVYSQKWF